MSSYNDIIFELKDFAHNLNIGYISSFSKENQTFCAATFANNIIKSLYEKKHLLAYLSKMHCKDLEDCLRTHVNKYTKDFENSKNRQKDIKSFHSKINEIIDFLSNPKINSPLANQELDLVRERLYKILKNAQLLFAEQLHNAQAKDSMQALSIAFNFHILEYEEQNALYESLLQIKELWEIDKVEVADSESVKYKFQDDPMSMLILHEMDDKESTFEKIVVLLTGKFSTLPILSDEQIIRLYDRLKNLEWKYPSIPLLLNRIHDEAQFRYSYNRLTDSGYELLNRFQSFDALMHQVDNLEFSIIESYFINRSHFIKDTLTSLFKHIDNLKGLALVKDNNLVEILKKMEAKIKHISASKQDSAPNILKSLQEKLTKPLDSNIQKRYVNLDKFAKLTIQNKYIDLFEKLDLIIEKKEGYIDFFQELFVKKLSKDFYLPNLSNSIDKLRKMAMYRIEVSRLLSQLNLADIFIEKGVTNKIKSLDFKHVSLDSDIKSSADYVNRLITEIVSKCTASQLEILYKHLIENKNLTQTQINLKEEIYNQLNYRTSLGKMIFSILKGEKKEYNQLKSIKESIVRNKENPAS